jgi:PST family polysaccharide transporter
VSAPHGLKVIDGAELDFSAGRANPRYDVRVTETADIHRRAGRSLWFVSGGQILVALVSFASGVVLARRLSPGDFGLFAISTFVVVFVGMIADLGLHTALIQRQTELTTHDLRAAFTLQQLTAAIAFTVLWPVTSLLPTIYPAASGDLVTLVHIMSADLFLLSWCRPGEALLERSLRYDRLVPIDVAVTTVYAVLAIILALSGVGVLSFGIAWVAGTITRLILVMRAAPWSVGLAWDTSVARSVLRIGAPLQLSRVVAQAQYWVTPTIVAATLGPSAAGLLQWAAGNGRKPLDILEYLARVSLPHFSRLQHQAREVDATLSRYLTGFLLVSGLWVALLIVAGNDVVRLIYTERWVPAVLPLVLFAAVGVLASVRLIVTTALVGGGQTAVIGRVAVGSALVTIVASVMLVGALGVVGVPLGQLVGAAVALPFLVRARGSSAPAAVFRAVKPTLLPVGVAVAVGLAASSLPLESAARGLVASLVMVASYASTLWVTGPRWLRIAPMHRQGETP